MESTNVVVRNKHFIFPTIDVRRASTFQLSIRRLSLPVQRALRRSKSLRIKKNSWSSGNFGSAGARSAPSTPQDLPCPSPGVCLTPDTLQAALIPGGCIHGNPQSSPNHCVFSKCDKSSHALSEQSGLSCREHTILTMLTCQQRDFDMDKVKLKIIDLEYQSSSDGDNYSGCSTSDKSETSLKHLSTSTPAMTAQAQLTEPPSPKTTKDPKIHTTSKARQKKFLRHFPNIEEDEKVLNYYSCALIGDILLQGHLYITKNYFAFYSNVFGYVTKLLIPILTVENITKEKTARIIPNAVGVTTSEEKHIFGSLMSRDSTLVYMKTVWQKAKSASPVIIEPEIEEPDIDSSETESGRDSPPIEIKPKFSIVQTLLKEPLQNQTDALSQAKETKSIIRTLKDAIIEFRKLPRQSLILCATTLLLILLFFSAGVLLYRISKIQSKYSSVLQDGALQGSNDVYNHLLQWHSQLHSKSAGAVNDFLDSNLDLIAQVRQSLEALSSVLVQNNRESKPEADNKPQKATKDNS